MRSVSGCLQASSTTLAVTCSSIVAGSSVTFTATVNGNSTNGSSPTGSVYFADQTGVASVVPLVASGAGGSATATFTTSMIGIGSDAMGASYSGDTTFAPSFATIPLTVSGLPDNVTLTATPTTLVSGDVVGLTAMVSNPSGSTAATPTGYIEFRDGSTIIWGPNSLASGSTQFNTVLSSPGTHVLSAWYSGDLTHVPNSGTATVQVVANPTFSFTPSQPIVSTTVAASITVAASGVSGFPTPTGSVLLSGAGFTSQAATLSNGTASVNIPAGAFTPGGYWLAAVYTPDAAGSSYYAATTDQGAVYLTVTSQPPGFTISGTSVSVAPGATAGNTSTITLTPSNGFTGAISLSCAITPTATSDPATCSIPASVTISGFTAQTTTLTVNTTSATSALNRARRLFQPLAGSATIACILLVGIPARRRRAGSAFLMLFLIFYILVGALGCGGGGGGRGNPGTTPGAYTITVTGNSGTITQTGALTLTVQ